MNTCTLYGRLGQDPESKDLGNDNTVASFSVATSRKYYSKKEDRQVEKVEWHSCSAFGKTGENIVKYLKKGDPILLTGRIEYRPYEKEGVKAKATNILVDRFEFVGGRSSDSREARDAQTETSTSTRVNHAPDVNNTSTFDSAEEMPF